MEQWIHAGSLAKLQEEGVKVVKGGIAVFVRGEEVHAVDNRCPHLGFPLHLGSVCDGILTCHWHHARFDIASGGTLDPWADDVPTYPVKVEQGEIWIDAGRSGQQDAEKHKRRLRDGLEQNISLVIAKAVVALVEAGTPEAEIATIGVEFGTTHRTEGWGSGLTILTAMVRVMPKLDKYGRILALFHGLVRVARDSSGHATRFMLDPLPNSDASAERLAAWYRQCVEVRDSRGAARVLATAIQGGAEAKQLAEMMLTAVTDHFYVDGGHTLDFHNKAFEILDTVGDRHRMRVLTSLVPSLGGASRSEEQFSWQSPVNLVEPLHQAFRELSDSRVGGDGGDDGSEGQYRLSDERADELVRLLVSDRPLETFEAMTAALKAGMPTSTLARLIALAAAERIAKFHTQNEFGDWITVLHSFTHAHAVHESLHRTNDPFTARALYYAAASIYLTRFLNIPPAPRPRPEQAADKRYTTDPKQLLGLLNQQQQVTEAGIWVVHYLDRDGSVDALFNTLGHALLREDAEFHSFQMYEAAAAEYDHWCKESGAFAERAKETIIVALTRYLAAHAPTARELPHTARIAWRLHRGEKLFED